jgi:hypothetical protein
MSSRPDIVVYSPDDRIQLVVEAKNTKHDSDTWAEQYRHNLLTHAMLPRAKYFMLATPNHLRLWRDAAAHTETGADYKAATQEVLRPYLGHWGDSFPDPSSFELLLKTWLTNLINSRFPSEEAPAELQWLVESGLLDAIRNGHVEHQPFV